MFCIIRICHSFLKYIIDTCICFQMPHPHFLISFDVHQSQKCLKLLNPLIESKAAAASSVFIRSYFELDNANCVYHYDCTFLQSYTNTFSTNINQTFKKKKGVNPILQFKEYYCCSFQTSQRFVPLSCELFAPTGHMRGRNHSTGLHHQMKSGILIPIKRPDTVLYFVRASM